MRCGAWPAPAAWGGCRAAPCQWPPRSAPARAGLPWASPLVGLLCWPHARGGAAAMAPPAASLLRTGGRTSSWRSW
eukprot:6519487-Pyramimonas_sp.AAC.1